jgi:class 3 adenylate cyclase
MDSPEVRYARSGDVRVAYQVYGKGPIDLVYGRTAITHLELTWEEPEAARFFAELGEFARVILWDKRGVGLSDRTVGIPTLEDRMDDVRAVMDAASSPNAVVFGATDTAAMALLFAATYPERVRGLILYGPIVRGLWAPDYPWVWTKEEYERSFRLSEADWGTSAHIDRLIARLAPSRVDDRSFKRWLGRMIRSGSSPSADIALARMNMEIDVRAALPAVHVPTLVVQCPEDRFVRPENSEYVVDHVTGARMVTVPGIDHLAYANPLAHAAFLKAQREFVESLPRASPDEDRVLLTILFVDIVGSTSRASDLGDSSWGKLLGRFFDLGGAEVTRHRGRTIKTTGDGLLAVFDGPTRAVRCASALREAASGLELRIRAGLHTGECVARSADIEGIAVHIAARICEEAGEGEVFVSGTVRDLSVGSDIRFGNRESRPLRGVEGEWRMYSVERS